MQSLNGLQINTFVLMSYLSALHTLVDEASEHEISVQVGFPTRRGFAVQVPRGKISKSARLWFVRPAPSFRTPKPNQMKSKKNYVRKRRTRNGKQRIGRDAQLIRSTPNLPIPERIRTSFTCEADYKIAVSTASTTSGAVKLNSPWLPFRPGGNSAFGSYTFLGPATESTLLCTGWSQLANANLYLFNKVVRSTIKIRMSGANSANNVTLTVVPALDVASFASIYTVRAAPLARQATFSVSKPNTGVGRDGWFSYSIDPYVLTSATRAEAKGDISLAGSYNLDPLTVLWWHVYVQTNDLDVSSTTASLLQVRVKYDVELYQLTQMSVT